MLITHDLGVVAELADRVLRDVRGADRRGRPEARRSSTTAAPVHVGLLGSIPRLDGPRPHRLTAIQGCRRVAARPAAGLPVPPRCPYAIERCEEQPPLEEQARRGPPRRAASCRSGRSARASRRCTPSASDERATDALLEPRTSRCTSRSSGVASSARSPRVHAVDGVSFDVARARRSGWWASPAAASRRSGARSLRLHEPTVGRDRVRRPRHDARSAAASCGRCGANADGLPGPVRVAQPAEAVGTIIAEPLAHPRARRRARAQAPGAASCWTSSASSPSTTTAIPHEFSGGQRQRIGSPARSR